MQEVHLLRLEDNSFHCATPPCPAQELSRLRSEYTHDLMCMAAALAASQAITEQRSAEVWLQLAAELGASREDLSGARGAALAAQGLQQQQQHGQQVSW